MSGALIACMWSVADAASAGAIVSPFAPRAGTEESTSWSARSAIPAVGRFEHIESYPELDQPFQRFEIDSHLNGKAFVGTLVVHMVTSGDGYGTDPWFDWGVVTGMLAISDPTAPSSVVLGDPAELIQSLSRRSRSFWSKPAGDSRMPRAPARRETGYDCVLSQPDDIPFPRCVSGRIAFPVQE